MKIVENSKDHLDAFIRLNEQWIAHYFKIEEADRQLAMNPYAIIEKGGYIFTLLLDKKDVAGVCALFKHGEGEYELARMAVAPEHRGYGFADQLMQAVFTKLRQLQAKKLSLVSNSKLRPAISLYKKHGFKVVFEGQHPVYARANIFMEKMIS